MNLWLSGSRYYTVQRKPFKLATLLEDIAALCICCLKWERCLNDEITVSLSPTNIWCFIILCATLYITREQLSQEIDSLREEQQILSKNLSNSQVRWHTVREEKLKASSILCKLKELGEDLISLAEEKSQIDLDEKVSFKFVYCHSSCLTLTFNSSLFCAVFFLNIFGYAAVSKCLVEIFSFPVT